MMSKDPGDLKKAAAKKAAVANAQRSAQLVKQEKSHMSTTRAKPLKKV